MRIKENQKERALVLIAGNGAGLYQFISIAAERYKAVAGEPLWVPALLALLPGISLYFAFIALGGAGSKDESTAKAAEFWIAQSFIGFVVMILATIGNFVTQGYAVNLAKP